MPAGLDPARAEPVAFATPSPEEFLSVCAQTAEGSGALVVVDGAAGTGKSALLAGFAGAAGSDFVVVEARASELETDNAFGVVRRLFGRPLETPTRVTRHSHFAFLDAVHRMATRLAEEAPLLIVVDDLQWADPWSLKALAYIANRVESERIVLAVGVRPAEPGTPSDLIDAVCVQPRRVRLRPPRLSRAAAATIVRGAVPAATDELCDACFEASGANPFYLHELTAAIGPESTVADVRATAIPALGDQVRGRAARIGPEARSFVGAAAVLGDGARLADVARVAGLTDAQAADAAARLQRVDILSRESPIEFAHPLVCRSVYAAVSVTQRNRLHARAGDTLRARGAAVEDVAAHLTRCHPVGAASVAVALREAGVAAMKRGAYHAAVALLERALDEGAPTPPRARLLADLGRAEARADLPRAAVHLRAASDSDDDPVAAAVATGTLARLLTASGEWGEIINRTTAAIARLGSDRGDLACELAAIRLSVTGSHAELAGRFRHASARMSACAHGSRPMAAVLALHGACRGADPVEARQLAGHALALEASGGAQRKLSWPTALALRALVLTDDLDGAAAAAAQLATRPSTLTHAWIAARRGELADAEVLLKGTCHELGTIASWVWDALGERSGLDAIVARAAEQELAPAFRATIDGSLVYEARGRLALMRGDRDVAVAELRRVEAIRRATGFGPVHSMWRAQLALALQPTAPDEAAALVAEELELAERSGIARPLGVALRVAAELDRDDEVKLLRRSVEVLGRSPACLERARSLVALGAALRRRSYRTEARERIEEGLYLARACGAATTTRRAAEEFRAAGGRSPRGPRVRTGLGALTPSELRVSRLAADGLSNEEIAQELFVTLKTVETHLTHVYAKLELSGPRMRRRLATLLGPSAG